MEQPPALSATTVEERRDYIKKRYPCISDCDICGLCKVFHGKDPELAFREYIEGRETFQEVAENYYKHW